MSSPKDPVPARARTFALIRIDSIDVVTSRGRGAQQFKANVRSISDNGLYKPILVNRREHAATGRYQLICGEGRLLAHRQLGRETIKAEIIDVDLRTAHIMSLGENMTKCPPQVIEYAYALLEMHQQGASIQELQRITGHPPQYIRNYLRLVEQGEGRLLAGVERGVFTLEFAMKVAETPDGAIQHVLMDAFDRKLITARHVDAVRRILTARSRSTQHAAAGSPKSPQRPAYSVDDLKRDIARLTREHEKFVHEAEHKETRVIALVEALRRLGGDITFCTLLQRHQLERIPTLAGTYGI